LRQQPETRSCEQKSETSSEHHADRLSRNSQPAAGNK
jgi:hypothetical protein